MENASKLRRMAKTCGTWAAARHMAKAGYPLYMARFILLFSKG